MTAPPLWRRAPVRGPGGRALALAALGIGVGAVALFALAPLAAAVSDARDRAERLNDRAAALTAAAAARREEAALARPPAAAIAAAEAWLAAHAPPRDREAAMLDLLSALRLLAQAADVELTSAAPVDLERGDRDLFAVLGEAGVAAVAAEARIAADHAGLARFLDAIGRAKPTLRAAALEVSARTSRADAEAGRLSARVVVGALVGGG